MTARRIRLYVRFISICGFSFCILFYCRNSHGGIFTVKDELATILFREVHMYTGDDYCPVPIVDYFSEGTKGLFTIEQKILALCNQNKSYSTMEEFFTPAMHKITKVGEGKHAEAFSAYTSEGERIIIKIMPIEGSARINVQLKQKKFEEILTEMVISKKLSDLGRNKSAKDYTQNFAQLYSPNYCRLREFTNVVSALHCSIYYALKMSLYRGQYPELLLEAWDKSNEEKKSLNHRPDYFSKTQLFMLFAFEDAGDTLKSFVLHDQREARSVFAQIAGTLAVGESALGFEHRDMNTKNILVKRVKEEDVVFIVDSKRYVLPSEGIKVSLIDYTLSRIQQGKCALYYDLDNIPRNYDMLIVMRDSNNGDWSKFAPKTNAQWMNDILKQMVLTSTTSGVKNVTEEQIHSVLKGFLKIFPQYDSAKSIFLDVFAKPSKGITNATNHY